MLPTLLTENQVRFLREEKEALADVRLALANLDVPRQALDTLEQAILQLDELFLLVVVGEFNAGKSALVNSLLGERVLPEGVTPTTSRVTLVKWGEQVSEKIIDDHFSVCSYPLPLLRELNIVDTPGTNAVIRHHERLTQEFVPRSDLVLFVTSADRPMTESERQFMEQIRDWGKKVVIALNKSDILETEDALSEVRDFVLKYAQMVLGATPEFFSVSARLAQQAWTERDPAKRTGMREASHVDALAQYIYNTLDDQTRIRLKLINPLGVADRIIAQAETVAQQQAQALDDDRETVHALDSLVRGYEQDLDNELQPRLSEVDNIVHRLQERGLDFFDTTFRIQNITTLARGDQVRALFEKRVLDDVPQQIQDRIQRLIDWLVDKDLHQWQQVAAFLQRRRTRFAQDLGSAALTPLDTRRRTLIDSVGKTSETIVETYNRDKEAAELAANVESAVAQVALIEAGAVGLGTLVMTALASSAADFTGLLAAGTLAIIGLFVIPYKRQKAKANFRDKIQVLREKLMDSLTTQFKHEADTSMTRLKEAVVPYTRFVHAERERVEQTQVKLTEVRRRVSTLRARVQTL